jgi:hypothetical protein
MGINLVQFQKGLSMGQFMERYGTEEKCHAAVVGDRERFFMLRPCISRWLCRSSAKALGTYSTSEKILCPITKSTLG